LRILDRLCGFEKGGREIVAVEIAGLDTYDPIKDASEVA
jgi:hypothetical protein